VGCQYQTHPTTTTTTTTTPVWTFLMKNQASKQKELEVTPNEPFGFSFPWGGGRGAGGALLSRYSLSNISAPSISHHVTNYFHNFTRIEFSMPSKSITLLRGAKSALEICNLILNTYPLIKGAQSKPMGDGS